MNLEGTTITGKTLLKHTTSLAVLNITLPAGPNPNSGTHVPIKPLTEPTWHAVDSELLLMSKSAGASTKECDFPDSGRTDSACVHGLLWFSFYYKYIHAQLVHLLPHHSCTRAPFLAIVRAKLQCTLQNDGILHKHNA